MAVYLVQGVLHYGEVVVRRLVYIGMGVSYLLHREVADEFTARGVGMVPTYGHFRGPEEQDGAFTSFRCRGLHNVVQRVYRCDDLLVYFL